MLILFTGYSKNLAHLKGWTVMNSFFGKVIGFNVRGNGAYSSMAILLNHNDYKIALLSGQTQPIKQLADRLDQSKYLTIKGEKTSEWQITREQVSLLEVIDSDEQLPIEIQEINCSSFDQFSVVVSDSKPEQSIPIIVKT